MTDDQEDRLSLDHTWLECHDCPLRYTKKCEGVPGDGGCFVPDSIIVESAAPDDASNIQEDE